MVLSRPRWIAALALSLILAIPITTLIASMVVFPILAFGALGIFANTAPLLLLAAAGLRRMGLALNMHRLLEAWQFSAVVWIGCAYGLSRWGEVGQTLGARNLPYFKVLFAPYLYFFRQPIA